VDVHQDSSEHIKDKIQTKYEARRETILSDARQDAKTHRENRKQRAEAEGESLLKQEKHHADEAAEHYYNEQKAELETQLKNAKKQLREQLEATVWEEMSIDQATVDAYLEQQLQDTLSAHGETTNDYEITFSGETLQERRIRASDNTKHYEERFADLINDIIEQHWSTMI